MTDFFRNLLRAEAFAGILLMLAAALAMLAANSPFAAGYETLRGPEITAWINDGLMAFFFLAIGLEIRQEAAAGALSLAGQARLPCIAALGGVIAPAVIFCLINRGTLEIRGWAIPSATDIAFSLGVLSLLGTRVPASLRLFLMTVSVMDDLLAAGIIVLFYAGNFSYPAMGLAAGCVALLFLYRRLGVKPLWAYLFAGIALWAAMWDAGLHAAVAGVILGVMMPREHAAPLMRRLNPWVNYGILPLFAFANAGLPLSGLTLGALVSPLPLGIALGLFAGKQAGIFTAAWLMVRTGWAKLPAGASWGQLYGVCMLGGIGFTMSLFIAAIAFPTGEAQLYARLGVLVGSLLSAMGGLLILGLNGRKAAGD